MQNALGIAGADQVRAAAKLDAVVRPIRVVGVGHQIIDRHADGDHADVGWIFLAEDRPQAVDPQGVFLRNHLRVNVQVLRDVLVDLLLDRRELFGR